MIQVFTGPSILLPHSSFLTSYVSFILHAVFHIEDLVMDESSETLLAIDEETAKIRIPREVLASQESGKPVRMASFLFKNMSGLLPQRLEKSKADNDRYMHVMYYAVCVKLL